MHGHTALIRLVQGVASSLVLWVSGPSLVGAEANVTRTNGFDRWITNVIEVRVPVNRFVNEYHTNWVTQLRTNAIDAYVTNRVTRTLTNQVVVDAFWTNVVVAYQTNWNMRILTNRLAVNVLRTNFVEQYQTNWRTFSLTNWETVVLFKTNWVTQPVTNVVQLDLPNRPATTVAALRQVAEPKEVRPETPAPSPVVAWAGPVAIEAARTARPVANNLVEVRLKVMWTTNTTAALEVQNWRVEREDGAILLFGQDREFTHQLPVGKYRVEARLKGAGDNSRPAVRGTLSVTAQEATIQQRLLVKK